jgi:putative oxidoreductase
MLRDFALCVVRVTVGALLAGHGSQKLLGWFGGGGLEGTGGFFESLGFRPGRQWAGLAAASELGGGMLTALGFLNPVGPLAAMGAMLVATLTAHAGKPIWGTQGGAELPVTNMAVLGAVTLAGPGRFSIDRIAGTGLPRWTAVPGALVVSGLVWFAVMRREQARAEVSGAREHAAPAPSTPRRLEVTGESGAAERDNPAAPETPEGPRADTIAEPLGDDAIAAVTRAAPDEA